MVSGMSGRLSSGRILASAFFSKAEQPLGSFLLLPFLKIAGNKVRDMRRPVTGIRSWFYGLGFGV